ncbi:MAG: GntR family transcriptional regulator [Roseovarius sp.]
MIQAVPTAQGVGARAANGETHSLSEAAHRRITELIRARVLRGGEMLVEQKLAERLGISRTPLREALQRLEGEGMIQKTAGRSFTVRRVDMQEYLQSLKMREVVEAEAASLAVGRVPAAEIEAARREIKRLQKVTSSHTDAHWDSDDEVHGLCTRYCGNAVMAGIIARLRVTTRLFEIAGLKERIGPDAVEHLAILDGLQSGDPVQARRAMRAHLKSLINHSISQLR